MKINIGYKDFNGKIYDNLKEISINRNENFAFFGNVISNPKSEDEDFLGDRFIIFQDKNNPDIAYKIDIDFCNYKNFINYQYCHSSFEVDMISKLIEKQPEIKRTDFPLGIVTIDHYMVGSEIVYYPNSITLNDYCKNPNNKEIIPLKLYENALLSLKEMNDNDIYYLDIHSKNFVIPHNTDNIKIIDFQKSKIIFYETKEMIKQQKYNLQNMILNCNKDLGINEPFYLNEEKPLEDAMEKIMVLSQKYR